MISGATGALAVVMVALVADHGAQYLFATVILMGIIQLLAGIFKLGKFIRMVPEPVMLGFVNGLAIVICISQLSQFKTINSIGDSVWISGNTLYYSIGFVALTMLVIWLLPKITKALPATLVAIKMLIFWNRHLKLTSQVLEILPVLKVVFQTFLHSNRTIKFRNFKNNFSICIYFSFNWIN